MGCRDATALNYDSQANLDGTCEYTKVIFYNGESNLLGGIGVPIDSVRIFDFDINGSTDETYLATLNTFDHVAPSNCEADPKSFVWELKEGSKFYVVYYHFADGAVQVLEYPVVRIEFSVDGRGSKIVAERVERELVACNDCSNPQPL